MPFIQIKNVSPTKVLVDKSFRFLVAVSSSESNLDMFRDISKICLNVILFLIIRILRDLVILVYWSG